VDYRLSMLTFRLAVPTTEKGGCLLLTITVSDLIFVCFMYSRVSLLAGPGAGGMRAPVCPKVGGTLPKVTVQIFPG